LAFLKKKTIREKYLVIVYEIVIVNDYEKYT